MTICNYYTKQLVKGNFKKQFFLHFFMTEKHFSVPFLFPLMSQSKYYNAQALGPKQ